MAPGRKKSPALKMIKKVAGRVDNFIVGTRHDAPSTHPVHNQGLLDNKFKKMQEE